MATQVISFQTGMASFIVATKTGDNISLEEVGTQPFGKAWSERRMQVIENAFDMFNQEIAPFEINYNSQRAGGIIRARRVIS